MEELIYEDEDPMLNEEEVVWEPDNMVADKRSGDRDQKLRCEKISMTISGDKLDDSPDAQEEKKKF